MRVGTWAIMWVFALAPTPSAMAQPSYESYGTPDWHELVPERRVEFQNYRAIVLSNPTLSDDEKARRIAAKFTEIEKGIRTARTAAYEKVSDKVAVGNSATKGSSGGSPKIVQAKCRGADKPDMYTKPDWARGAYQSGGVPAGADVLRTGHAVPGTEIVASGGAQVCAIELKQSGRGRKVSYSEAEFRIRPATITGLVDREVPLAMAEVTRSPL